MSVFLYTFAIAIIAPVYPLFMKSITNSEVMVGIIYGGTSIFGLIFCILCGELMQKYGRGFVLKSTTIILSFCFVILTIVSTILDLVIVESIRVISVTSGIIVLGVLVKAFSRKENLENSESKFYTFSNIAWFLAPAGGGLILMTYDINAIFLIAAFFTIMGYMSLEGMHLKNRKLTGNINFHYIRAHIINKSLHPATYYVGIKTIMKELKNFIKNKNLVLAYMASFGLYMLFSTQWIYLPIILDSFNASRAIIGLMTGALVIPLIFLEIPLTHMSKRISTRKFMVSGFVIISVAMTSVSFFYNQYIIIALFLLSVIGAAMVEPFKDAYLLKHCPAHKTDVFFGIFKTSQYLGYSIAPIINSIAILFLGLEGMFFVIGPLMMIFAIMIRHIE